MVIRPNVRIYIYILVGGFNSSEKHEFVSWDHKLFPIYGKIIQMFQTTNQHIYIYTCIYPLVI